ncbi:uncharacterized protein BCR38DRAFT_523947 [Pseudomassariella vexata]|uniref:Transcription initiation factor IIF subunit alpha n=1 Tax=Pseudomassariella vexata TaxID=1141098 RepID=A0A1Y2E231_9PEZI|nr:uncharacterized protein BCR38DRAFT_523947 [Pseudomassariella vexata]ORY65507.1 hypothetical protein BCR38DRAFT_523947 [Pseudomassariella vexata]
MSASPSGGPNGQNPTPPPGARGPLVRKKPRNDNPLVARRKPQPRPAGVHAPGTPMPAAAKAAAASRPANMKPQQQRYGLPPQPNFEELRKQNGGWSAPPPPGAREYPLFLTKKGLKEGLRFHVMRLAPPHQRSQNQSIDPTNQDQFTRPVTLHRRDPRQPAPGREVKEELPEQTPEQIAESEKLAQAKADREAQRAIDDAQKAPVMRDAPKKSQLKPHEKKKTGTQAHYGARTEQQKKESEIRYEEALPWHLEDADGKNVWVGQYEAPLSETKVAFIIHEGGFRMVPMEKWYKFSSKRAAVNALSIEEAEKVMGAKAPVSRWAMRDAQREEKEKAIADSRDKRVFVKQEAGTFKAASRQEKMEHDDIDMSGDEFQDDDETAGFEPDKDEDTKESKDRIRREQLGANLFGDADEGKVEKEEAELTKEELERKLFGKDLKKALKRRDKQFQYDSDDSEKERDPFATSSESDSDSEDEDKKEDDKDSKDKAEGASKGNDAAQGKKAAAEAAKKGKSLKRAGSPVVSDSSGAESNRKKKKKTGALSSSMTGSRSTTPMPGSQRRMGGAGSTSDGEATGGEMSDSAGGPKKKKQRMLGTGTGAQGTPTGSRAGSPNPTSGNHPPNQDGGSTPHSPGNPITGQEIHDKLPPLPDGIPISNFLKMFGSRIGDGPGQMPRTEWLSLVKKNSVYTKEQKLLKRKQ